MTGPSHAGATKGVIYTSGEIAIRYTPIAMQPATRMAQALDLSSMHAPLFGLRGCLIFFLPRVAACSTAVKVLYSTVATAQLAVHTKTESSGFRGNLIRPATFSLPGSVSIRAVVDKRSSLREESVKRYTCTT